MGPLASTKRHKFTWVETIAAERGAWAAALRWGYPRELFPGELESSIWYRYGHICVFWFNAVAVEREGDMSLHICADPEFRSGREAARVMYGIYAIAGVLGAKRLTANVSANHSGVMGYCKRLGWRHDEGSGLHVYDLGEG